MPAVVSRMRSRRAFSSGGQVGVGLAPSSRASTTRRSVRPPAPSASATQRLPTGSRPPALRMKATRRPSGAGANARGSPSRNRRVAASWRGKLMASSFVMAAS